MNKYPYVTIEGGSPIIIYKDRTGIFMDDLDDFNSNLTVVFAGEPENYTIAHLANTYGKVESPEHAGFIVELCEVNGVKVITKPKATTKYFLILSPGNLYFYDNNIANSLNSEYKVKQITIPTPPKSELKEAGYNLVFAGDTTTEQEVTTVPLVEIYRADVVKYEQIKDDGFVTGVKASAGSIADNLDWHKFGDIGPVINARVNESSKWKPEAGKRAVTYDGSACTVKCVEGDLAWCKFDDNELMINVHVNNLREFKEDDKMKDWPQVGDEVVTSVGSGVVKLPADDSGFYIVLVGGAYLTLKIKALSKPKTEEEILRDDIAVYLCDKYNFITGGESLEIVNTLMSKYSITKKGE